MSTIRFDVFLITGLNLQIAQKPDEVDILKEEIARELSSALGNIKLAERGVFVQASTLGALEALLDFLKSSKIPVSFIEITTYDFYLMNRRMYRSDLYNTGWDTKIGDSQKLFASRIACLFVPACTISECFFYIYIFDCNAV